MARHSFIQMSKLPNVKGRISYITSHAKQENLYATYRTADNTFWNNLARESQQEFLRSGTTGKCIEARELIIALPEIYTTFDPQQVLEEFTNKFRQQYGVECVSALHHNKRKTNYHIHLIFSERKLLPEPDIKIATRSVFYATQASPQYGYGRVPHNADPYAKGTETGESNQEDTGGHTSESATAACRNNGYLQGQGS